MKLQNLLLTLGLIALPIVIFGIYQQAQQAMATPLPVGFPAPTPSDRIEVKQYPAYRSGTYVYEGKLEDATGNAFNPLYNHISSNNIAMTSPVEARYPTETLDRKVDRGIAQVSFLYRSTDIVPQQVAKDIKVEDHPPMLVVSIGIQGAYSYTSYQDNLAKLQRWLAEHPEYQAIGEPRRFFYDSPFTPAPLKRSEVQIPIRAI
ncbi:heme-binding protein [Tumidithrix elongata RA019]|uniref:Heme-binding protein n=1 Tax=Tumidithrix elongata BACA0141 TaxID=2716417 RepID=A0AAW9Q530_9CYAN|nr:heme-binding protein [Tumidithrix elongata RA019]